MKSFSSSAINKSGKKFAPKAPIRRAAPAPPRRPSVPSQASASQTPQPAAEIATPEPSPASQIVEPPAPVESATPEPSATQANNVKPSSSTTAIPIPRPTHKAPVSAATPASSHEAPTPSQSTQPSERSEPSRPSPLSRSSPPPPSTSPADPVQLHSATDTADTQTRDGASVNEPAQRDSSNGDDQSLAPEKRSVSISDPCSGTRPSKRVKITPDTRSTITETQPAIETPQLITPPATQTPAAESTTESQDNSEAPVATDASQKATKSRKRKSSKDENAATKTRKPRARKQREETPEGSEQVEIAPAVMKMSELCKDLRTGKKSKRETELRKLEQADQERKQAAQQDGSNEEPPAVKENENANEPSAGEKGVDQSQSGPVMRIVNGEIVLDTSSLQVDRHAAAARSYGDLEDVVENSFTRKINQSTYGKRTKTESWDEELTDLFYRGLRMFGTDFMMISKLFPGRSRRHIKLKFNKEERRDPGRIKDTLMGPRETFDIHTYSEMTNTVFDDPRVIQQELDEERKRIEEQHAKEKKAQEELLHNPDGAVEGATDPDKSGTATTKGKRNKKQTKDIGGAQEEILGTIDDFP